MIKTYCDCCGGIITEKNIVDGEFKRLSGTVISKDGKTKLKVEVIVARNNVWNEGDWCKYCVLGALYAADDRPRQYDLVPLATSTTTKISG